MDRCILSVEVKDVSWTVLLDRPPSQNDTDSQKRDVITVALAAGAQVLPRKGYSSLDVGKIVPIL